MGGRILGLPSAEIGGQVKYLGHEFAELLFAHFDGKREAADGSAVANRAP
jgi:hypothetical protein